MKSWNDFLKFFDRPVSRRQALRAAGAAVAMAGASSLPAERALAAKKPNIVFILTDDHRWDCLGIQGHPFLKTPTMDRLAREGVLFRNAFVTTSLCSPSRASFLTGQYASRHGVLNNFTPWDERNVTFMELLKKARVLDRLYRQMAHAGRGPPGTAGRRPFRFLHQKGRTGRLLRLSPLRQRQAGAEQETLHHRGAYRLRA